MERKIFIKRNKRKLTAVGTAVIIIAGGAACHREDAPQSADTAITRKDGHVVSVDRSVESNMPKSFKLARINSITIHLEETHKYNYDSALEDGLKEIIEDGCDITVSKPTDLPNTIFVKNADCLDNSSVAGKQFDGYATRKNGHVIAVSEDLSHVNGYTIAQVDKDTVNITEYNKYSSDDGSGIKAAMEQLAFAGRILDYKPIKAPIDGLTVNVTNSTAMLDKLGK